MKASNRVVHGRQWEGCYTQGPNHWWNVEEGGADRCEWGNGESWKNGRDNSGLVYSSFDASTVCPPSGLATRSSITTPLWPRAVVTSSVPPPVYTNGLKEQYDPELEYSRLPEDERTLLERNSVVLSDGVEVEEGWLVCLACEKKTHILPGAMLSHILSKKHETNLGYFRWQEERQAPAVKGPSAQQIRWISVTDSADLPKFIEETPMGYRCTLCDKNPQSVWCLEMHINGKKHKTALEREAWRQQVVEAATSRDPFVEGEASSPVSSLATLPPPPPIPVVDTPAPCCVEEPLYAPNGRLLPPGFRHVLEGRRGELERRNESLRARFTENP